MLNKDYAGINSRIGLGAIQNATVVGKDRPDLGKALADAYSQYDSYNKQQALTEALKNNDQNAINNAMADINPMAYAQMLKSDAQRAEDRKWALDDMATKHRYDLELEKAKDKEATAFQRNFDFIKQTTDLSDDDIIKLMYGGQNPTLDMAMLNPKGLDAHAKKTGEILAEQQAQRQEAQDKLNQMNDLYGEFFNEGGLISKAQTGGDQPDTLAGRLRGVIQRKLPTDWVKEEAQTARQNMAYNLGKLKLDESSALKGAISDKEQEFLQDMTAGNITKYSPAQIKGALDGIMKALERQAGVKQPTDEDAWGGI